MAVSTRRINKTINGQSNVAAPGTTIAQQKIAHLFIVGAGFSHYAGLPLTSEFTTKLLDIRRLRLDGPSSGMVDLLKQFVLDAFGHEKDSPTDRWPDLEDIFTCIDLSANSGHHLGPDYSPSDLRTIRRGMIVRIIRMLRQTYNRGRESADADWKTLENFFSLLASDRCGFLSMNWDTVIEEQLRRRLGISSFSYGCDAIPACFQGEEVLIRDAPAGEQVQVLKPHGSANWLYCDACRQVFWFPSNQTEKIAQQLFRRSDWTVVRNITGSKKYTGKSPSRVCPLCKAEALGTRFATFSYRKALDFPMHESSWRSAERLLQEAKTWIFIGYSLPAADYEFKHLLKRVQLSRIQPLEIVLITGGGGATATGDNYLKFFGPQITQMFRNGLNADAIQCLQQIKALHHAKTSHKRRVVHSHT